MKNRVAMLNITSFTALFAGVFFSPLVSGQDSAAEEALAKKFTGQTVPAASEMSARGGLRTRGYNPTASAPKMKTRSVIMPQATAQLISRGSAKMISSTNYKLADDESSINSQVEENGPDQEERLVTSNAISAPSENPSSQYGELAVAPGKPAVEIVYTVDPLSEVEGDIRFEKGTVEFADKDSEQYLKTLGRVLNRKEFLTYRFAVEGHASADGDASFNQTLSQQRANVIFNILVNSYGVKGERLFPVGYGESEATVPDGAPEAALQRDRRVMIVKMAK